MTQSRNVSYPLVTFNYTREENNLTRAQHLKEEKKNLAARERIDMNNDRKCFRQL